MYQSYVAPNRIFISRLFFLAIFSLVLLGNPYFSNDAGIRHFSSVIAFIFVVVAVLGRLWCSLYLCGYKSTKLVALGPYSVVRNPLYLFRLIGTVGIGIASTSFAITSFVIIFFAAVYPSVIAKEEQRLGLVFGPEYRRYLARTPSLVPNYRLYKDVANYTVNMHQVHAAFIDVAWFFIFLGLTLLLVQLHNYSILPMFFDIY